MVTKTGSLHPAASSIPEAVLRVLDVASRAELLWLDPTRAAGDYHGVAVRGRTWVGEAAARQVAEAVRHALQGSAESESCFDPQYAVRFEASGEVAEVLFCFPCHNAQVVGPGGVGGIYPAGGGPRRLLRRLLRAGGVLPWWRLWD